MKPPRIGLPGLLTVLGIAALIGLLSFMSDRDREYQRELVAARAEITRLSTICAPAQAGEKLVATIPDYQGGGKAKCLYTSQSGYGRAGYTRASL